jgi:hypothetical protein
VSEDLKLYLIIGFLGLGIVMSLSMLVAVVSIFFSIPESIASIVVSKRK